MGGLFLAEGLPFGIDGENSRFGHCQGLQRHETQLHALMIMVWCHFAGVPSQWQDGDWAPHLLICSPASVYRELKWQTPSRKTWTHGFVLWGVIAPVVSMGTWGTPPGQRGQWGPSPPGISHSGWSGEAQGIRAAFTCGKKQGVARHGVGLKNTELEEFFIFLNFALIFKIFLRASHFLPPSPAQRPSCAGCPWWPGWWAFSGLDSEDTVLAPSCWPTPGQRRRLSALQMLLEHSDSPSKAAVPAAPPPTHLPVATSFLLPDSTDWLHPSNPCCHAPSGLRKIHSWHLMERQLPRSSLPSGVQPPGTVPSLTLELKRVHL